MKATVICSKPTHTEYFLSQQLQIATIHEVATASDSAPHLIAQMTTRMRPIHLNTFLAEQCHGDLALRPISKMAIQSLKDPR